MSSKESNQINESEDGGGGPVSAFVDGVFESPKKIDIPEMLLDNSTPSEPSDLKNKEGKDEIRKRKHKNGKKEKEKEKEKKQKDSTGRKRRKSKPESVYPEVSIDIEGLKENSKRKRHELAKNVYEYGKDEPWNLGVQMMLMKISEKAMGYRWMHNKQRQKIKFRDELYSWLERILSILYISLTGGGTITLLGSLEIRENIWAILIVGSAVIILEIMHFIVKETHNYQDFQEKMYKNEQSSRLYGEIHLNIQEQIALRTRDRRDDKEFLTFMIDKYNNTFYQAPILSNKVTSQYLKATKKRDITLPINFQDDGKINIYVSPNEQQGLDLGLETEGRRKRKNSKKFTDKFDFEKRYNYEMMRFLREF